MVGEQQEEATEALANWTRLGRKAVKKQKDEHFAIISYFPISQNSFLRFRAGQKGNFRQYIKSDFDLF